MKWAKCSSIKGGICKKLVTWLWKKAEVKFFFPLSQVTSSWSRAFVGTIIGACWKQWLDADPERYVSVCGEKRQAMCNDNRKRISHLKKEEALAPFSSSSNNSVSRSMRSCARTRHELMTETQLNWAILCGWCHTATCLRRCTSCFLQAHISLCIITVSISHRLIAFGY